MLKNNLIIHYTLFKTKKVKEFEMILIDDFPNDIIINMVQKIDVKKR